MLITQQDYPGGRIIERRVLVPCTTCGHEQDVTVRITDEPRTVDYPGHLVITVLQDGECARCTREITDDAVLDAVAHDEGD